ncbi:Regulator of sirC expression, contains transglutaminase-like and TPR domains [Algoriphagus locisalis]|uniref:Regulator of sirC expression, contains transglutaminase-like and TPR domains n=1 Tax=Algoriphagus locisalis TaxID=305507 RepID=A0A1I7DWI0_9BACT|nr:transglutaminase-like domain-containing protein [Algoriphagus locisalis]SFU16019.1 Regulator of sirC expression, contains transglutaminase-like and TPR domains [Algoriphagus locisalis]
MSELTPGELNALVSLLDDSDREVRMHVRDRIISLGNDIIPFLEKKWENSFNPDIQKEIEELVHDLQFSLLKERLIDWRDTDDRDLLTGLWIINTYQYPDLEYAKLNAEMHQIYFDVWTAFKNDLTPYEQVRAINNVLFNTLRFSANTKNFHSPANSMLSSVLDSKRGNPLTLCSIYLLVAKKLGLPIYGVNLPNLFVLTYKSADVTFYINAFNKGLIFSRKDIFNYLEQLKIEPKDDYFEPCAHLQMMLRMFRNLENSFDKLGELDKVGEIKELIALLNDQ